MRKKNKIKINKTLDKQKAKVYSVHCQETIATQQNS